MFFFVDVLFLHSIRDLYFYIENVFGKTCKFFTRVFSHKPTHILWLQRKYFLFSVVYTSIIVTTNYKYTIK